MQFTLVIFSTYKFAQESLVIPQSAPSFFMSKNYYNLEVINLISLSSTDLSKLKNNFFTKRTIFTSPQLKITLFNTVLLQLKFITYFCYSRIATIANPLNKEKSYVSMY